MLATSAAEPLAHAQEFGQASREGSVTLSSARPLNANTPNPNATHHNPATTQKVAPGMPLCTAAAEVAFGVTVRVADCALLSMIK
jgi:hypothetical protein